MSDLSEKAELLVELHRNLLPLKIRETELKNALAIYEGETVVTKDGSTVQITKGSSPTRTGNALEFNENKFWSLPGDIRAQLERMGVARMVPKYTRGASPSIRVTLK